LWLRRSGTMRSGAGSWSEVPLRGRWAAGRNAVAIVLALLASASGVRMLAAADDPVLREAAALRAARKFPEALEVLRGESRQIKALEGEGSRRLAAVNDLATEILIDTGELETASSLLAKTIDVRRKFAAEGTAEAAAELGGTLLVRARLESAAKRLPAAVETATEALRVIGDVSAPDLEAVGRARTVVEQMVGAIDGSLGSSADATRQARAEAAKAYTSLGMFAEAIDQRQKVLAGVLGSRDATASELRESAERLGRLMGDTGFASEALEPVEKCLASLVPVDIRQANAVRRLLGELQVSANQLALAKGTFEAALAATQAESRPSPVEEAADRMRCLLVSVGRGNADRLPDWFEPAVKLLSRPPQTEAGVAVGGLITAARIQRALATPAAGLDTLNRALALAAAAKPPDAGLTAELLGAVVHARLSSGDTAGARKAVEQALPAAERDLGPGDPHVGFLRVLLADALQREAQNEDAAALGTKAIERGLPRPSDAWEEDVTAIYDRIASATGKTDLRERYVARRAEQFGANHAHLGAACRSFGVARLAAGDWNAAIEYLTRTLDIQRAGVGDDHPDTAASTVMLAHAELLAGKARAAVTRAAEGVAAWERIAGPDHPGTLSAIEVLVEARIQAGETSGLTDLLERLCGAAAIADPLRQSGNLVRLAALKAAGDKARTRELVTTAMQLPCWGKEAVLAPSGRVRLALTAAIAAHVYRQLGDAAKATETVQLARGLALQADDPKPILDRIEQVAVRGEQPAARP